MPVPEQRSGTMRSFALIPGSQVIDKILKHLREKGCVVQRGVAVPPDSSPFARMANADMAATMQDEVAGNLLRLKGILEART